MRDEALKLALEALESDYTFEWPAMHRPERAEKKRFEAITAIREALAQPEQEPVEDVVEYFADGIRIVRITAQPAQEQNFCPRCGKRTADLTTIHTCTPPRENT